MKIISFGTLKGGTGKTTVAFNIGGILAENKKVLFIDVDPQSNLSDNVGIDTSDQDATTIRNIFSDTKISLEDVIIKKPIAQLPNIDIIASHIRITEMEMQLVSVPARETILLRWLKRNLYKLELYDYIIIDTNPSMSVINQNAFMVADSIILISDVSRKSIQGAQLFMYLWGEISNAMNLDDKIKGLILNNYDKRIKLSKDLMDYYKEDEDFKNIVLQNTIPARVDIKNTELCYLPVNISAADSDSCKAFRRVTEELKYRGII